MTTRRITATFLLASGSVMLYGLWSLALLAGRPGDVDRLVERLDIGVGSTVAEIGAGSGRWAVSIATRVGSGGHVFATELDEQRISVLQRRVSRVGLGNATVLRAGVRETGLADGCCEVIYMRAVAHHLEDGAALFGDVRRALRPGGRFAVIDFAPDGPWRWHFLFHDGPHGVTLAQVRAFGKAAGLTCIQQVPGWSGGFHLTVFQRVD